MDTDALLTLLFGVLAIVLTVAGLVYNWRWVRSEFDISLS